MVSMNFSWISHHFDEKFVCVADLDHTYHPKILVAVHTLAAYPLSLLPLVSHIMLRLDATQKKGE